MIWYWRINRPSSQMRELIYMFYLPPSRCLTWLRRHDGSLSLVLSHYIAISRSQLFVCASFSDFFSPSVWGGPTNFCHPRIIFFFFKSGSRRCCKVGFFFLNLNLKNRVFWGFFFFFFVCYVDDDVVYLFIGRRLEWCVSLREWEQNFRLTSD
jgi:hypothetical protein